MEKKQNIEKVVEPLIEKDFEEVETPVVEKPKVVVKEKPLPTPKKNTWEIKDRVYFLKSNKKPISKLLKGSGIHWFDEEAGYERELKYTSNQKTCFVDEMTGDQITKNAIFIPPDERYSICRAQASSCSG